LRAGETLIRQGRADHIDDKPIVPIPVWHRRTVPLPPAVELIGVTVTVGDRTVLGPVDFVVAPGEHWVVLGPNGAGKSTLLSVVGAYRHPSTGRATVLGGTLGRVDLRVVRRRIGSIGEGIATALPRESTALEITLTGRDGYLAPWWSEFSNADRVAATAALERVGCGALTERPIGLCSQGERQRILLARALFGQKELLLLDEPAGGLDLPGRESLIAALDALASGGGPPSVHIAHTLEELPESSTHALLLRDGHVVASGVVDDVITADALSACYSIPITVDRSEGRWFGRAQASW
jgi:iron complex transport system ATP-binding protein